MVRPAALSLHAVSLRHPGREATREDADATGRRLPGAGAVVSALLTLLPAVALAWLAVSEGDAIVDRLGNVSLALVGALLFLQLIAIGLRAEAWKVALDAANSRAPRRHVYAAASAGAAVGTIFQPASAFVQIAALRRFAGRLAPTVGRVAAAVAPAAVVELSFSAVLGAIAAIALGAPWWAPTAVLAVIAAILLLVRPLRRRLGRFGWAEGLNALAEPRAAIVIVALVGAFTAIQLAQTWLVLEAVGLSVGFAAVTVTFLASGALQSLPAGASMSTWATVLVLGHEGVAKAASGGLALAGVMVVGTAAFLALAFTMLALGRRRARRARAESSAAGGADGTALEPSDAAT